MRKILLSLIIGLATLTANADMYSVSPNCKQIVPQVWTTNKDADYGVGTYSKVYCSNSDIKNIMLFELAKGAMGVRTVEKEYTYEITTIWNSDFAFHN